MKLITVGALVSLAAFVGCNNVPVANVIDFGDPVFDFDGGVPFVGPQPVFGPTVSAATPPPALSGGTLLMLKDGKTAVAADPDRDLVSIVDLTTPKLSATVSLMAGDEPGRVVEDGAGQLHLVLRRAGAVATIDPATATVTTRTPVCAAPRGIAYEAASDLVHVACAGGELVSLPAGGGPAVRAVTLDRDLRDVVMVGAQRWVSTFRTAQILVVNADGSVAQRIALPHSFDFQGEFAPAVAWRMLALPDGHIGVAHQRGIVGPVSTTHGGYGGGGPGGEGGGGGGCGGIVQSAVSMIDGSSSQVSASLGVGGAVLPVDFAYSPTEKRIALVSAGNAHTPGLTQISLVSVGNIVVPTGPDMGSGPDGGIGTGGGCQEDLGIAVSGEVVAIGYDASGALWVQTREPATLQKVGIGAALPAIIKLSKDSRADTAWAIFHSNSGANIACASCHPEGGEDSRVWEFDAIGPRRTQTLRGHVGGTEPFHWSGELPSFDALVGEVYLQRMAGPSLAPDQEQALFAWINAIPLVPQSAPVDAAAVARGKTLFEDTAHVACSSCHSGPQLTNNAAADVGTGGSFQVPRLIGVGFRAPFLHDGCAATLTDRFTTCGGSGDLHGVTSQLTPAQIADLVAYLQTL